MQWPRAKAFPPHWRTLAEKHLYHLLEGIPRGPGVEPALHLTDTLAELGYLTELRGDPATARDLHLEALTAAQRVGDPRSATWAVEGLASAVAAGGDPERAALLLGLAAAVREHNQTPAAPSELAEIARVTRAAMEALGEAEFGAAYERGGRLKLDDAADLA